jgi:hemerythrin-like domain-containing protein
MPVIDLIPDNLVREPVEYLFADHVRQRTLCGLLKTLTEGDNANDDFPFADTLVYLVTDRVNHLADEEEELFPRLRARLEPKSELARLLDGLQADHRRDRARGQEVAEGLRRLAEDTGVAVSDDLRASIKVFVSDVTAHLSIEDEQVFPLARSCLAEEDFEQMGRAMARRRGIDYPA